MARYKEDEFVNYVAKMKISKEMIDKENLINRRLWTSQWGYILPVYSEMNKKLDQGQRKPLPSKIIRVDPEEFAHLWPDSESQKSKSFKPCDSVPPPTTNQLYGWKVGKSIVGTAQNWVKPRYKYNMFMELGWSDESLW